MKPDRSSKYKRAGPRSRWRFAPCTARLESLFRGCGSSENCSLRTVFALITAYDIGYVSRCRVWARSLKNQARHAVQVLGGSPSARANRRFDGTDEKRSGSVQSRVQASSVTEQGVVPALFFWRRGSLGRLLRASNIALESSGLRAFPHGAARAIGPYCRSIRSGGKHCWGRQALAARGPARAFLFGSGSDNVDRRDAVLRIAGHQNPEQGSGQG